MVIPEIFNDCFKSHRFTEGVWSIEYQVLDGKQIVYKNSFDNLNSLRFF